ncbi:MAG: O-methyltransferase, family 3 [Parcubacteria group bacterium GW2011_GWA1_47_8]|nr:MAG: O-methyltransferase, family 3 [Parcubacteria group bacterium GW2011_GWA1_47_8]
MKYKNPIEIETSYSENDIGRTLYDLVLKHKPKKIIEFGVLYGYSTVVMAMALDEIGEGHIYANDLFEDYEFKHSTMSETQANVDRYGLSKYVTLQKKNFEEWLKASEDFDLLHVDVSNKGDTIERLYEAVKDQVQKGSIVLFEGGSEERDNVAWMIKYNCKKIRDAKVPFEVIDEKFPSLSMMKKI